MTEPLNFKPVLRTSSQFNPATTALNEGSLTVLTDTQDLYVDTDDIRIKLSDVVTGTYSAITNNDHPVLGKIYFAVDTHQLLQASSDNGSVVWHELGGQAQTAIVNNSNAAVSITLSDNTIYRCTSDSLSSLTISGLATGFRYASITFTSPATATTFAMPATGYYCVGAACDNGVFTPEASMRYNLAIEDEGDRIAIYVMEAL